MLTKFIVIPFHSLCKLNHYAVHLKLIQCLCNYISIKLEKEKVLILGLD